MLPTPTELRTRCRNAEPYSDDAAEQPGRYCIAGAILMHARGTNPCQEPFVIRFPAASLTINVIERHLGRPLTGPEDAKVRALIDAWDDEDPERAWRTYADLYLDLYPGPGRTVG